MESDTCNISYTVNGVSQGTAFEFEKSKLNGAALFPHIIVRNIGFKVNFGAEKHLLICLKQILDVELAKAQAAQDEIDKAQAIQDEIDKAKQEAIDKAKAEQAAIDKAKAKAEKEAIAKAKAEQEEIESNFIYFILLYTFSITFSPIKIILLMIFY